MTTSTDQSRAIPATINMSLALFHALANVYQFFVLPLWLLPGNIAWGWTLLPLAVLNNPYWSLIHETIHDLFHRDPRTNALFGRAMAIMFGAPFRVLRLSHLLHHKLNRSPVEGTEIYERGQVSAARAWFGYFSQILGGLYLFEFLSAAFFFLPRRWLGSITGRYIRPETVSGILMRSWLYPETIREIRVDGALTLAWFGAAVFCFGSRWPILILLVGMRAFLISFLDNVYHYRTPVKDTFYAKNLRLPAAAAKGLLYFNFHGIHHQNPSVPWIWLPVVFRERAQVMHGNYLLAALIQLRGPVALQDLPRARQEVPSQSSRRGALRKRSSENQFLGSV